MAILSTQYSASRSLCYSCFQYSLCQVFLNILLLGVGMNAMQTLVRNKIKVCGSSGKLITESLV